ncbi:hypothetical protein HW555_006390 [Spodoptera exigua]|uniref:Uncharacterized protein n=1 Tax=Spodoptera exigua TaxID=7107 RepID=A0A835GF77_SPOEX|nr:hypothetical protein HW555_006390 [Spodoptera exigua]
MKEDKEQKFKKCAVMFVVMNESRIMKAIYKRDLSGNARGDRSKGTKILTWLRRFLIKKWQLLDIACVIDSDTENELLIQPSDLQIEMDENFEIGSFNKSRPQITSPSILGPDTSATSSASGASSECSSPSSSVMSGRKRRKFTIDVTKKRRKCNKENWIDTKRKLLQNLGKKHLSRKGKEQKGKDMRPSCDNCKFKCDTKISEESRKQVFDLFWGLGNHVKQWEFIGKYTKRHMKRRITTDNESKRTQSVHYFLPLLLSENDSTVKVCKLMFKNTLSVSNQFIQSAMDKYDKTTGFCEEDRRGRHGKQTKLLTETVIQSVCDHVKSFQPVESHYTRKDTNKLYLDSSLNFSIMFKMYKTWAEENNLTDIVQTLRQYRDVVNSHMNVGFFIPKKDQCDQCTANKNNPPNESQEQITFAKHIQNKNSILNQYKWVKNEDGDKVKWNQVREIVVENSQPDKIFYKYDLNEKSALCIDCSKRTSRRVTQGNTLELRKAYGESLPITTAKYKDLMSLCQKNLIPPRYHDYYKNIKHTSAMSESEAADDLEREE